jgi:general stress protein 26
VNDVKKEIIEVIRSCEVAFVSTINLDNFPETRVMLNVLNREIDERLEIYFDSNVNAPKVEQAKKNSNASLYYYNETSMNNLILFGKLEIVTNKEQKDKLWHDSFLTYYKNGKDDASYGILKFIPSGYKYYTYKSGDSPKKNEGKL